MSPVIRRTLAVASAVLAALLSAPTYSLAASGVQPRTSLAPVNDAAGVISRNLRDPYQQAALRLMTHGMLDGQMLPNGQLTVRPNQPMTGGDAMNLLARALGKNQLARRLGYRPPEFITGEEWLKGALAAARGRMAEWGAPTRPEGGAAPLNTPVSNAESIALLMMGLGVQPRGEAAWPYNILRTAVEEGIISIANMSMGPAATATRGLTFYLADNSFYGYNLGEGKTVYTQYETNASLIIEPYPSETTQDKVILSGIVSGSAKLVVKAGAVLYTFTGDGQWSVVLPLMMGANLIEIHGTDTNGGTYVQDPPVIITRLPN